jgi:hypothetical protein
MYPEGELRELALRKEALRVKIAAHRAECVAYAEHVARPIAAIDRVAEQWRRVAPYAKLAAIPLGFLLQRRMAKKQARAGGWKRWLKLAPVAMSAARIWERFRR